MASSSINWSRNGSGASVPPGLPQAFYARETTQVARELLGKVLVVRTAEGTAAARIVETEAYRENDPAAHSFRGETPRSKIMFGEPGRAYVYFIYGMYEMLNFVTEPQGTAGAVLIRAAEPLELAGGEKLMRKRRGHRARLATNQLLAGPGKLCRALGIQLAHNGESLSGPKILVADDGYEPAGISVSPRVGIRKGVETPWRYFITGNPCVSRAPQNAMARPFRRARRRPEVRI